MSSPDDLPADLVVVDEAERAVALRVDPSLYPISAIYGAAYVFIDRCYVLLDKSADGRVRVTLAWKKGAPPEGALRAMAGEFANELLSCAWRAKIAEESRSIIEATTARALSGAMGAPTLDDLEGFEFGDDALDDPLGIAMSWEQKYGKKKPSAEETREGSPALGAPGSTTHVKEPKA